MKIVLALTILLAISSNGLYADCVSAYQDSLRSLKLYEGALVEQLKNDELVGVVLVGVAITSSLAAPYGLPLVSTSTQVPDYIKKQHHKYQEIKSAYRLISQAEAGMGVDLSILTEKISEKSNDQISIDEVASQITRLSEARVFCIEGDDLYTFDQISSVVEALLLKSK